MIRMHCCTDRPVLSSIRTQLLERGMPENNITHETFGPELVRVGAA